MTATLEKPQRKLRPAWFRSVTPALESAVRALPEDPLCTHELLLALLDLNLAHEGRVALVERDGMPVAVFGLRRDGRLRWRSMMNWLMPGTVGAAREEDVVPALRRLGVETALVWWDSRTAPEGPGVVSAPVRPLNRLSLIDREAYWRSTKYLKTIIRARHQTAHLTVAVDQPGDADWVFRQASLKWAQRGARLDHFAVAANIEIARQLMPLGRCFTTTLRDGARPLAGATSFRSGQNVFAGTLFRDESVGNLPTGIRVIDESFARAHQLGATRFDMGASFPYKKRWAPEEGSVHQFVVSPVVITFAHKLRRLGRGWTDARAHS